MLRTLRAVTGDIRKGLFFAAALIVAIGPLHRIWDGAAMEGIGGPADRLQ